MKMAGMAHALVINQWMRALVAALSGANDALAYAIQSGDCRSSATLRVVARAFLAEPWHAFMVAVPGWCEEVVRCESLLARAGNEPADEQEAEDWTIAHWSRAMRQVEAELRLGARHKREVQG
jgi:hypothetical protein